MYYFNFINFIYSICYKNNCFIISGGWKIVSEGIYANSKKLSNYFF